MRLCLYITLLAVMQLLSSPILASQELLQQNCMGCHVPEEDGSLSRINGQRKTPEGWQMTIRRMETVHGIRVGNQEIPIGRSTKELVKFLADTQGLAPSESAPYRYLIEQRLNHVEAFPDEEKYMCGRCHSGGRFALQRRTSEEWELLVHFHLGQFPTIEYQMYGRDRDWVDMAFSETVPLLTEKYPFDSKAWTEWQQAEKPDLSGRWVISGHMAGQGFVHMVMTATASHLGGGDSYELSLSGTSTRGEALSGSGKAIVYTGYEWRGSFDINGTSMRMMLASDTDGNAMTGRMYQKGQKLLGMDVNAGRDVGASIASVLPGFIGVGEEQLVLISGSGLSGEVEFGDGILVQEMLSADANHALVRVKAVDDMKLGMTAVSIGGASSGIKVHSGVDSIVVEPAYAIARVGGNGPTADLKAAFRAVALSGGEQLGYLPSASWRVEPFDEIAERDGDAQFAGVMNAETGVFSPAGAGPNPERKMSTNNAGNLKVIAESGDLAADGQLIVTVQTWLDPPLR